MTPPLRPLVLASTSRHRQQLLERVGCAFVTADPKLDEAPFKTRGLSPEQLVLALAEAKARAVKEAFPEALIVGADQVAEIDGEVLGKPGDFGRTVEQLVRLSARRHRLLTGLCLLDVTTGTAQLHVDVHHLRLRSLNREQIEAYVARDKPFDCAGGYRIESAGIALFERIEGQDHTAIIGLPMLQLVSMLANVGRDLLSG